MSRIASLACAVLLTATPFGASVALAASSTDTTVPVAPDVTFTANSTEVTDSTMVTDSTYVYDLENEPSQCINSNPRPGCGKKPEQAGDRGGSLQYLTFLLMLTGVGIIGTVLIRNVIKRDRAIAEQMKKDEHSAH